MISLALFFLYESLRFMKKRQENEPSSFNQTCPTISLFLEERITRQLIFWKLSSKQTLHHALYTVCGTPRAPAMDLNDLTFERPWPMVTVRNTGSKVGSCAATSLGHYTGT